MLTRPFSAILEKRKRLVFLAWFKLMQRIIRCRIHHIYLHVFDELKQIHHQMEEQALEKAMLEIDDHTIKILEYMLPNGKKLEQNGKTEIWSNNYVN